MATLKILLKITPADDTGMILNVFLVPLRKKWIPSWDKVIEFSGLHDYYRFLGILGAYPVLESKNWWSSRYWAFSSKGALEVILKNEIK